MTLVFAENRAFLAALEGDVQSRRDKALCNHPLASDCRRLPSRSLESGAGSRDTYPVFLTRAVYDNYVTVPP